MSSQPSSNPLVTMDPLEVVRRLEPRLFRSGRFDPAQTVAFIVEAAILCGAHEIGIRMVEGWTLIFSPVDWLAEDKRDVAPDAFRRITSYAAGGDNSMRPEVLLSAFAVTAFTISSGGLRAVKGDPRQLLDRHPEITSLGARVVGFKPMR